MWDVRKRAQMAPTFLARWWNDYLGAIEFSFKHAKFEMLIVYFGTIYEPVFQMRALDWKIVVSRK